MRGVPILTYHSLHARDDSYSGNDHIALESDLVTLKDLGFRFVRLSELVDRLLDRDSEWFQAEPRVALSFDDGVNHDFIDFEWPGIPTLKSFHTLLSEFNAENAPMLATSTSFVIASQNATAELDRTCIAGREQWNCSWWRDAAEDGLISIGNHSWDHLHGTLSSVAHSRGVRDDFAGVDNEPDAIQQIGEAEAFIRQVISEEFATGLFAYPEGRSSEYLVNEYFPNQSEIRAAFTTEGRPVTIDSDRWLIPRYVCGDHWRSPDELAALLQGLMER